MIPTEIAKIMALIYPAWPDSEEDDIREIVAAAQRIWDAGYRAVNPSQDRK